jgi:membrane protein
MSGEASLWGLGGLTPVDLGKVAWAKISKDEVFERAAALSYYFLLALFPLLLFMLTLLGFMAGSGGELRQNLFTALGRVMPSSAGGLVQQTITEVVKGAGGGKAFFSLVGALWAASAGMVSVMQMLNVAYGVKERRSFVRSRGTAVGLTIAASVLVILALVVTLYGGKIADIVSSHVGLGGAFTIGWKIVQWPVMLGFMFATFALIYYFGPDLQSPAWHWITPGSGIGLVLWIVASLGIKLYLTYFNSYNKTYGSLAGVVILMLWLYVTGIAILVGGEVNAVIGEAQERADERLSRQRVVEREVASWGKEREGASRSEERDVASQSKEHEVPRSEDARKAA